MAKKKVKIELDLDNLLGSLGDAIDSVNPGHNYDSDAARVEDSVGSGSRIIDNIIGSPEQPGVLFKKRVTHLLAVDGAGKTTLLNMTAAQAQKKGWNIVYFDTEAKAFSVSYMEKLGLDFSAKGNTSEDSNEKGFFKIIKCQTVEQIDAHLTNFEETGLAGYIDVIILDSVATAIPAKALELAIGDSRQLGLHAVAIQKLMAKMRYLKEEYNWAIGLVNQMRRAPDIGGSFQAKAVNKKGIAGSNDSTWTTTGGLALLHEIHQYVFLDKYRLEKDDNGETVSQLIKITTTKNMVGSTGRIAFVKLIPNVGFDDFETLVDSMLDWEYIEQNGRSWDIYTEEEGEDFILALNIKCKKEDLPKELRKHKGVTDKLYEMFMRLSQAQVIDEGADTELELDFGEDEDSKDA